MFLYELFPSKVAALVGVDYAGLKGDAKLLESCQHLQNAAYWGRKFVALKVYLLSKTFSMLPIKVNTVVPQLSSRVLMNFVNCKGGSLFEVLLVLEGRLFIQMSLRTMQVK